MSKYCPNCGQQINEGAAFCASCGTPVNQSNGTPVNPGCGKPMGNGIKIGFSEKAFDPKLLAMEKKKNRAGGIFFLICIPIPVLVTFIIGLTKESFELMPTGFFISAVFIAINVIMFIKRKSKKPWDGTVIDKKTEHRYREKENGDSSFDEYIVVIRDNGGKKRKIKEGSPTNSAHRYFEYFNIGDGVRFHPQFEDYYEKYDKTKDTYVFCPICRRKVDIANDVCPHPHCGAPVIK